MNNFVEQKNLHKIEHKNKEITHKEGSPGNTRLTVPYSKLHMAGCQNYLYLS